MTAAERFAALIETVSGNVVPEGQRPFLRQTLDDASRAAGFVDSAAYLNALERGNLDGEWRRLLPRITVKESFLFRIPEQFEALTNTLVPALLDGGHEELRVWSAACARGEEPATAAVTLADHPRLQDVPWTIVGTDLDEDALKIAAEGRFGARAVARVPPRLLERWFRPDGRGARLGEELRQRMRFRPLNLFVEPFPDLGGPFQIVFLRNVLIYFRPEAQRRVLERIQAQLHPDGYLFLGHSESPWKLTNELEAVELDGCFAYRRRAAERSKAPRAKGRREADRPRRKTKSGAPASESSTLREPRSSRHRVHAERDATAGPTSSPRQPTVPSKGSPPFGNDPVEEAVAALSENRSAEARQIVDRILALDPENALGHALEGFLHDLEDRAAAAIPAYRAALFLEPGLYPFRLLLAARLEETGFRDRARAEYREVLTTLEAGRSAPAGPLSDLRLPSAAESRRRARRALERL